MENIVQYEGASSSSAHSSSQTNETSDDGMIALVLSEEYASLDGAVASRLSNLSSVPVCSYVLYFSIWASLTVNNLLSTVRPALTLRII